MSSIWTFTCEQHPHLRWHKTKCGAGFIGRGALFFDGDLETGLPSSVFSLTEHSLSQRAPDYQLHHRLHYAVECDCPLSLLRVVEEDHKPFAEQLAEYQAMVEASDSLDIDLTPGLQIGRTIIERAAQAQE